MSLQNMLMTPTESQTKKKKDGATQSHEIKPPSEKFYILKIT